MRYRVWDPYALEMYDQAGLTQQQRAFTEGLLRSLETGTYLSEQVASANSVVLALTRAHHVLDEHALRLRYEGVDHALSTAAFWSRLKRGN